jgi:hypothetical protein
MGSRPHLSPLTWTSIDLRAEPRRELVRHTCGGERVMRVVGAAQDRR